MEVVGLDISSLSCHEENRVYFDDLVGMEFEELKNSIRDNGINEPLTVMKSSSNKYTILSGNQRYRAALDLELKKLPCIIRQFDDPGDVAVFIVECNVRRRHLSISQRARALAELFKKTKGRNKKDRIKKVADVAQTGQKKTAKLISIHEQLIPELKSIVKGLNVSEKELYTISQLSHEIQYAMYESMKNMAKVDIKSEINNQVEQINALKKTNKELAKINQDMHTKLSDLSIRGGKPKSSKEKMKREIVKDVIRINTSILDLVRKCKESGVSLKSINLTKDYDDINVTYRSGLITPPMPIFRLIGKPQIEEFIDNSQDSSKTEQMIEELLLRFLDA